MAILKMSMNKQPLLIFTLEPKPAIAFFVHWQFMIFALPCVTTVSSSKVCTYLF